MFDDFKDSQHIAYSLLINSINNDKVSHAYLIDGNNNEDAFDFVMSFVKMLLCINHYSNYDNCDGCNQCKRIDDHNFSEVKIIESDSLIIKKEQLLELQSEFSRIGIENNKRVYIIRDCDKMNKHAANSLLKFLEEPEKGIIAILFTNNAHNVLETIKSRCQLIRLSKNNFFLKKDTFFNFACTCCNSKYEVENFLNDTNKKEFIDKVLSFIDYYEENGLDIMIYLKKKWYNNFLTREDSILALILMINFYYDVLKFKNDILDCFFVDYMEYVEKVADRNILEVIIKKINVCIDSYEALKCNLNVNLLLDNMIIKLGE